MGRYLNFEKEEKGYKQFYLTRESIRANIGKIICYVTTVDERGQYFVRYGMIHSVRYNNLFLDDMERDIDIRDVKDCGIKLE